MYDIFYIKIVAIYLYIEEIIQHAMLLATLLIHLKQFLYQSPLTFTEFTENLHFS